MTLTVGGSIVTALNLGDKDALYAWLGDEVVFWPDYNLPEEFQLLIQQSLGTYGYDSTSTPRFGVMVPETSPRCTYLYVIADGFMLVGFEGDSQYNGITDLVVTLPGYPEPVVCTWGGDGWPAYIAEDAGVRDYFRDRNNTWIGVDLASGDPPSPPYMDLINSWWDASDASTVDDPGTGVTEWRSKVGEARLIKGPNTNTPLYAPSVPEMNGLGCIDSTTTAATVVLGLTHDNNTTGAFQEMFITVYKDQGIGVYNSVVASVSTNINTGASRARYRIQGANWNSNFETYVNEVPSNSQPVDNPLHAVISTGNLSRSLQVIMGVTGNNIPFPAPAIAEPWQGYIGEILTYSTQLTPEQRTEIHEYLYEKWGITP